MGIIDWVLINGGNLALALWSGVKTGADWLVDVSDRLLDPILSPILSILNPLCTAIGDVVYVPLGWLPSWASLILLSIVAGILALVVFRYTSNQKRIGQAKDDIKANLLALKLYRDELRVTFLCQAKLLWAIARLQRYMLFPVLIMLPPMLLMLAQMGLRHQWRPLEPGEQTFIEVTLAGDPTNSPTANRDRQVTLEPSSGISEAVAGPGGGRIVWRVRAGEVGRHTLRFNTASQTIEKELVVGTDFQRVSAVRTANHWGERLLHPSEPGLPVESQLASIEIRYPGVDCWLSGQTWWLLTFFVVSMAAALILKPLFRVKF